MGRVHPRLRANDTNSIQQCLNQLDDAIGSGGGGGGSGSILWRPAGGGDAQTWAQVLALVGASTTPIDVYCDTTGAPTGNCEIPPGAYDAQSKITFRPAKSVIAPVIVNMQDGAVVSNLVALKGTFIALRVQPTAAACLTFTPGVAAIFGVEQGAVIENLGSRAAIDAGAPAPGDPFSMVLAFTEGGSVGTASVAPIVDLTAATSVVLVPQTFLGQPTPGWATGVAGSTIIYETDGTALLPLSAQLPGFLGTVLRWYVQQGTTTTAGRAQLFNIQPGFMIFDTDVGQPIWWDGAVWVTWGAPGTTTTVYDTLLAGGAFLAGDPVSLDAAGDLVLADANAGSGTQEVYGLAITNGVLGNPATVVTYGVAPYAPGGLTVQDVLLLELGGGLRNTPPDPAFLAVPFRRIVRIGQARTASSILVRVQVIGDT